MTMTAKEAPSLFSSLPNDIVLNVLARVPRRYHTILCRVSNKLRSLVRSSELRKTRSLMGKDCFYVCFKDNHNKTYHWFSLTEDRRLVSIPFPSPPKPRFAALMVGHEIYFIGGHVYHPRRMWILDSRSGEWRRGPRLLVVTSSAAVGLVDDKIYIFGKGSNNKIQAPMFDLKTQTWQISPNPSIEVDSVFISLVTPSLDRKIYARNIDKVVMRSNHKYIIRPSCVVDNVLYMYYNHDGLKWYYYKEKAWRTVHGLKLEVYLAVYDVAMADYNGKLAFLWHERKKMEIWCSMITLHSSKEAILGQVEWSSCLLSDVPSHYYFKHYFGSD